MAAAEAPAPESALDGTEVAVVRDQVPWFTQQFAVTYADHISRYQLYVRVAIALALVIGAATAMHWIAGVVVAVYATYMEKEILFRSFLAQQIVVLTRTTQHCLGGLHHVNHQGQIALKQIEELQQRLTEQMLETDAQMKTGPIGN